MGTSGKAYVKALVNLGVTAAGILFVTFVFPKILVFFMPFVMGWIIAWIANPLVLFFEEKLKVRRKAGTALVIIAVLAVVLLCVYLIGVKVVRESIGLVEDLPRIWNEWEEDFLVISRNMGDVYSGLPESVRGMFSGAEERMNLFATEVMDAIGTPTIEAVGNFAKYLPTLLIGIIMCLLSSYFFIAEKEYLGSHIKRYVPQMMLLRWNLIIRSLKRAVGGYFKAQLKIEIWIYLLLCVGFVILKVDHALLIALGIAVLDFLPVFGAGAVLFPWALIKALSTDYQMALGLMILWCGGQLVRQLIQPKIVGDSIGLAPLPTLFLLFAGFRLGGVVGMIIAVPLGIIVINLCKEGVFDTAVDSLKILLSGLNRFRQLEDEDRSIVKECQEQQKKKLYQKLTASQKKKKR